jgi:small subunit ribosomal protein S12
MPTLNQLVANRRRKKVQSPRLKSLDKCPQKKGVCVKVFITSPKKPNSANRKVARVRLTNKLFVTCSIPGEGHGLQKFSTVLIRGARVRDLPGVKYKAVRGVFDLSPVKNRKRARSVYGAPKSKN